MEIKKEIQSDIEKYASISAIAQQEGGKILIKSLKLDILSSINFLTGNYKIAPEIELRASISKLEANLGLYRVITRAERNKEMAMEELEQLIKENKE